MPTERWVTYLRDTFRTMWYVPIAFVTGQTGKNVKALLNHAQMLFKQSRMRVSTPDLNRVLRTALDQNPPPMTSGKRPKIYYATQVAAQPPTIVFFCNSPQSISAAVSALSVRRVSRSIRIWRSADQALPAAPRNQGTTRRG